MTAEFLTELFGLDGQVAVVIGGTGVLGGALSEGLARAGAHVVVAGRSEERGQARVRRIGEQGGNARYLPVDILVQESLRDLLRQVLAATGRVDMLVNCAGINSKTPYYEIDDADWDRVLHTNLKATHWACQVFAAQMAQQPRGGSILNIGSVAAHVPLSRVFAYAASKAAVVNLSKNLARELAPQNIRVNVLCPGFFPAEQNRELLTPERTAKVIGQTPLARFGEPSELVGAALLLLSRKAGSFMTGADVYVDGGFTAMRL
jgi:NAD(P)-dependent dehydrogenase (short-subunit alcohol dehydrogenase family)